MTENQNSFFSQSKVLDLLTRLKAQIQLVQFAVDHPDGAFEEDASIGLDIAQDVLNTLPERVNLRSCTILNKPNVTVRR